MVYKKGVENRVADAPSRKSSHDSSCAAISTCTPLWIQEVVQGYQSDDWSLSLIAKLAIDASTSPNFTLCGGLLRYKERIWIGTNIPLQMKLLNACHSTSLGGHSGVPVTYMRMKKIFAWKGMKADVHKFVKGCVVCQQAKPDRTKLPGLLQPLEVPSQAWHTLSLDFVEGLPSSGQFNCILVVVDSFTKYGHFIPMHHPFNAAGVDKVFMQNIYKLHGLPSAIISDQDRIFTSKFW